MIYLTLAELLHVAGRVLGPEVAVPDGAPAFDRALGKSGRDPGWTPQS